MSSSIHLPLHEFELCDLAFGLVPFDHGSVIAAATASRSAAIPVAKEPSRLPAASASQASRAALDFDRSRISKRSSRLRAAAGLPEADSATSWLKRSSNYFDGLSEIDVMLDGKLSDIYRLRAYVDAQRGRRPWKSPIAAGTRTGSALFRPGFRLWTCTGGCRRRFGRRHPTLRRAQIPGSPRAGKSASSSLTPVLLERCSAGPNSPAHSSVGVRRSPARAKPAGNALPLRVGRYRCEKRLRLQHRQGDQAG